VVVGPPANTGEVPCSIPWPFFSVPTFAGIGLVELRRSRKIIWLEAYYYAFRDGTNVSVTIYG